uniref:DUF4116 domain-containing protein n=1 Tax=Alexandrium monilatum TaxID=311494 RepID=A0A6T1H2Q5_9DINO
MAPTKEEVERLWLEKRAKGRQSEDLAAKQRKAAEEAVRRRKLNEEAAAKQRKAKEEALRKQREQQEEEQRRRELLEQAEAERLQQEEARRQRELLEQAEAERLQQEALDAGNLPGDPAAPPDPGAVALDGRETVAVPDRERLQQEAQRRRELLEQAEAERLQQEARDAGNLPGDPAPPPDLGAVELGGRDLTVAPKETVAVPEQGAVPDMEDLLGSIDRMEFFDLGTTREEPQEQLPALPPPIYEFWEKPEEDVAGVEERRARLAAKARARRQAFESKVKEAIADAQVSALTRQLRPRDAPEIVARPGQPKPKAAVRMPRRMKIGGDTLVEAMQPLQMPSSGLSMGGLAMPLTAQAAASGASSASSSSSFSRRPALPRQQDREAEATRGGREQPAVAAVSEASVGRVQEAAFTDRHREAISNLERGAVELEDLDEDLRACQQVVHAALRVDGHALAHAAEELRNDRDTVLAAVYESGLAIRHAGRRPRRDREIVLVAVMDAGAALEFAARELQADREVVLTAIENDPDAVRFAPESLMDDRGFVLAAAQTACRTFQHASSRLKRDRDVVMAAVTNNPDAFMHAAPELRADRDFVLAVVRANGCAIAHAAPELRRDQEVRAVAIASDPLAAAATQN